MRNLLFLASLITLAAGCEQSAYYDSESEYLATIVGFDLNCSTCILEFPDDNSKIKKEIGESPNNFYNTVNMSRGDYDLHGP